MTLLGARGRLGFADLHPHRPKAAEIARLAVMLCEPTIEVCAMRSDARVAATMDKLDLRKARGEVHAVIRLPSLDHDWPSLRGGYDR